MGWKQNIGTALFSNIFWNQLKTESKLLFYRLRCFTPRNLWVIWRTRKIPNLLLNIGAGDHRTSGWVSIDLCAKHPDVRWDIRWGLPFLLKSVERIHCEHFLEHLEYPGEANKFLKECHRVLQDDGEFRLIVPDAEKYILAYACQDQRFWKDLQDLGGGPRPFDTEIEIMNQAFRMGDDHRFAYDRRTLQLNLSRSGFSHFVVEPHCPEKYLDKPEGWRIRESLYLTVRKTLSMTNLKAPA